MENIDELIEKAKEIGHDEVPELLPIQAERKVLVILNSKPDKQFKTAELNIFLQDAGIEISNISSILSAMAFQGKCERIQPGIYRAQPEEITHQTILKKIKMNLRKKIKNIFSNTNV